MDISTQVEVLLRDAGYETWTFSTDGGVVVCFENSSVVGFVHEFGTAEALLSGWQAVQQTSLARHAPLLRLAGDKAWNVYSIFLTPGPAVGIEVRNVERIDENFELTRKIARVDVRTPKDVEQALLPLLSVRSSVDIGESAYHERLQTKMSELPQSVVSAFLGNASPSEVALLLTEKELS